MTVRGNGSAGGVLVLNDSGNIGSGNVSSNTATNPNITLGKASTASSLGTTYIDASGKFSESGTKFSDKYAPLNDPKFTGTLQVGNNIKLNATDSTISTTGAISTTGTGSSIPGFASLGQANTFSGANIFNENVTIGNNKSLTIRDANAANLISLNSTAGTRSYIDTDGNIKTTGQSSSITGYATTTNPTFTGEVTINGTNASAPGSLIMKDTASSAIPNITLGKTTLNSNGKSYIDSSGNIETIGTGTISEGGNRLMPKSGGDFTGNVTVGGITLNQANSSISTSGNISTTGSGSISTINGSISTTSGMLQAGSNIKLNGSDSTISTTGAITTGTITTNNIGSSITGYATTTNPTFTGEVTINGTSDSTPGALIMKDTVSSTTPNITLGKITLNSNGKSYIDSSGNISTINGNISTTGTGSISTKGSGSISTIGSGNISTTGTGNISSATTISEATSMLSDKYAPKSNPIFTGNVTIGSGGSLTIKDTNNSSDLIFLNSTTGTKSYIDANGNIKTTGESSSINGYATTASPTFTGDVKVGNITLSQSSGEINATSITASSITANNTLKEGAESLSTKYATAKNPTFTGILKADTFNENGTNLSDKYASLLGATFTGDVKVGGITLNQGNSSISTSGNISTTGTGSISTINGSISTTGSGNISTTGTGSISSANTISSTGTISEAASTLASKYVSSTDLNKYAKLDGATFTGDVKVGGITLKSSDSSISTSGNISTTGSGNISTTGTGTISTASGTISEAGKFLSSTYASLGGANTFTGQNTFNENVVIGNNKSLTINNAATTPAPIVSLNTSTTNAKTYIDNSGNLNTTATINGYAKLSADNMFSGLNTFSGKNTFSNDVTISNNKSLIINDASSTPNTLISLNPAIAGSVTSSGNIIGTGVLTVKGTGTGNAPGIININDASNNTTPAISLGTSSWAKTYIDGTGNIVIGNNKSLTINDASATPIPIVSLNSTSGTKSYIDSNGNIVGTGEMTVRGSGGVGGALTLNDASNTIAAPNITLGKVSAGLTTASQLRTLGVTYIDSAGNLTARGGVTINGTDSANPGFLSINDTSSSTIPNILLGKTSTQMPFSTQQGNLNTSFPKTFIDSSGALTATREITINNIPGTTALTSFPGKLTVRGSGYASGSAAIGQIFLQNQQNSSSAISFGSSNGTRSYIDNNGNILGTGGLTVKGTSTTVSGIGVGGTITLNDNTVNGGAAAITLNTTGGSKAYIDNAGKMGTAGAIYATGFSASGAVPANGGINATTITTSGNISTSGNIFTTGSGNISTTGTGNISSFGTIGTTGNINAGGSVKGILTTLNAPDNNYYTFGAFNGPLRGYKYNSGGGYLGEVTLLS